MRVRVELRRYGGVFIPRFRPQTGFTGELTSERRTVQDRHVVFLRVRCEPRQGFPHESQIGPELFEPRIVEAFDNRMHIIGFEVVDRAIHCQEWDCYFL